MADVTNLSADEMALRIQRMEEDFEAYEAMMENHKTCIADLEKECERLTIENKQQAGGLEQVGDLETEVASLKQELQQARASQELASSSNSEADQLRRELAACRAELDDTFAQVQQRQRDVEELRSQLAKAEAAASSTAEELAALKAKGGAAVVQDISAPTDQGIMGAKVRGGAKASDTWGTPEPEIPATAPAGSGWGAPEPAPAPAAADPWAAPAAPAATSAPEGAWGAAPAPASDGGWSAPAAPAAPAAPSGNAWGAPAAAAPTGGQSWQF